MKIQYYFEDENSEMCFTKGYFEVKMLRDGVTEMEVFKAIPDKEKGIFWCKHENSCGDSTEGTCGKNCEFYVPRNGKSGCCKDYTNIIYIWGEKVTLKLN
jgi:hypothetical protein